MPKSSTPQKSQPQCTSAIQPRLLNARDAATYLGIGSWAMRQLHWDGTVRGIMVGRRLLWDKHALDRYVDSMVAEVARG